jgi:PPP family 3-phenylpropionic acid transporter
LSAFYAAKFGHLGIVMPFLAPWLQGRGLGALGIGLVMALPPLFKVATPWLWGRWADRGGRRRQLLIVACFIAATALAAMTIPAPLPVLCLLVGLYGFARAPIIPYLEATALEQSESRGFAYGPVRLWGSVSFMLTSSAFGAVRGPVSDDAGLLLAAVLLGVCALLAVRGLPAPTRLWDGPGAGPSSRPPAAGESSRADRGLLRLLLTCALMQVSHGAYYAFYSIHLADLGYRSVSIGALWALGVLCEILLLTRADALLRRFGSRSMMITCLLLAAVRWLLIGTADEALLLVIAQILHAATYAGFHVAAVREVYRRYGTSRRASGQAMYSGMTFGLGMFVGSLSAGALARSVGLPAAFVASAFVALAAVPLLPRGSSGRS